MTRKILLAEDDRIEALVVRALLERDGYRVEVVGNGRQGLDSVTADRPDLVISDVSMPEMDGYAFCDAMKADPTTSPIPFILLTGRRDPADILDGLLHGADNFISKPFDPAHLLERIRRILQLVELRDRGSGDTTSGLIWNGREVTIKGDQRQIVELLFAEAEELAETNRALAESRAVLERLVESLAEVVRERTRLLQHTLEGYKELVDGVDEMIFACDRAGVVTSVNAASDKLLRRPEGTVVGGRLQALVAPSSWPRLEEIIDEAGRGGRPCDRIDLLDVGGASVPAELRLLALREDELPVGYQGIARMLPSSEDGDGAWMPGSVSVRAEARI